MKSKKRTYKAPAVTGTRKHAVSKAFSLQKRHGVPVFIFEDKQAENFDYGFVIPQEIDASNVYRLKNDAFFDDVKLVTVERMKPSDVKDSNYTYRKKAEACIHILQNNMLDRGKIRRIDWETPFTGRVLVSNPSGISNVYDFTVDNHNGAVKYRTRSGNWLNTKPSN